MDKICGVYKIISPSSRIYIGQTLDFNRRISEYKKGYSSVKAQTKLYRSINKYGWENHLIELIEECSIELLNERERYWQEYYNVLKEGLNCLLVNTDNIKMVLSDETKLKMSIAKKGKKKLPLTEEHKKLLSEAKKGKKLSEYHRKCISKGSKGTRLRGKHPCAKKVINTETNEIFECVKDAWENLNRYSYSYFRSMLNGNHTNKTVYELL